MAARVGGRTRNDAASTFTVRSQDRRYTLRRARARELSAGGSGGGSTTLRWALYQGLLARVGREWPRPRRHEQPTRRAGPRHARAFGDAQARAAAVADRGGGIDHGRGAPVRRGACAPRNLARGRVQAALSVG